MVCLFLAANSNPARLPFANCFISCLHQAEREFSPAFCPGPGPGTLRLLVGPAVWAPSGFGVSVILHINQRLHELGVFGQLSIILRVARLTRCGLAQ